MTSHLQARLLAKRALVQHLNATQKRGRLQAGFTLIELLVVIVIIGILSAVGIPAFIKQQNKAIAASNSSYAASLGRACAAALAGGETYTVTASSDSGVLSGSSCGLNSTITVNKDSTKATNATATIGSDGAVTVTKSDAI